MVTISGRDFIRNVSAAKRAADAGPVVITDRGEPAYVLLSIDDYRRLHCDPGPAPRIGGDVAATLQMDDDIDIDFEPLPSLPPSQAQAGAIVAAAAVKGQLGDAWAKATAEFRGADISLPERSGPRPIGL